MNVRRIFWTSAVLISAAIALWAYYWIDALFLFIIVAPLIAMGIKDIFQKKQSVKRNFPVVGRLRYFFEMIRPEIQQYFIESDTDGATSTATTAPLFTSAPKSK